MLLKPVGKRKRKLFKNIIIGKPVIFLFFGYKKLKKIRRKKRQMEKG